jgi:hypothetical protein
LKYKNLFIDIELPLDGMGIVFYSDGAVKDIKEGYNYFQNEYSEPKQVAEHIKKGDIVGFCTGSGGNYTLKFRSGYPTTEIDEKYPIQIRLAIDVDGDRIYIKDLFWLMDWYSDCPKEQQIEIEKGIYHITLCTIQPESGILGYDQTIYVYLNRLDEMPQLTWQGVPQLYKD